MNPDGYTPPPPGSTAKQLPAEVLALIPPLPYLSTACGTAKDIGRAIERHPGHEQLLRHWQERMHAECRINHKFTGELCFCCCHKRKLLRGPLITRQDTK